MWLLAAALASAAGLAPARGRFLVAERDLRDPNFAETVVLLADYGTEGAMGLIVNWPTAAPLGHLDPAFEGAESAEDRLWVGGPVAREVVLMLLRSERDLTGARRVFDDVHLSLSRELLEAVLAGRIEVDDYRLYSGYAGWSPGQLDGELAAGGWRVAPGDADLVFHRDPDGVWPELIRRGEVKWTGRGGGDAVSAGAAPSGRAAAAR